jgi:tetratricopeptide (TPR) repeat protein
VSIADLESDELDFDSAPAGSQPRAQRPGFSAAGRRGVAERGGAELVAAGEDLPFDPQDARMFDAEPGFDEDEELAAALLGGPLGRAEPLGPPPGRGIGAPDPYDVDGLDSAELTDDIGDIGDIGPVGPAPDPTYRTSLSGTSRTVETPVEVEEDIGEGPGEMTADLPEESMDDALAATSLEDDLDEADFFVSQGLWDEARDILRGLLQRHANHPLVIAKLRDVEAMSAGLEAEAPLAPRFSALRQGRSGQAERAQSPPPAYQGRTAPRPVVLLEKPIEDSDADTHFDLGLAYKEMGLHDEAIKAFHKVLSSSRREVQSHMMIGLCHREQGNLSEAINQFKAGLYVDKITTAEKFGLYYEIGSCYEDLEDPQEALYYYEMVLKKEHGYRDVTARVAAIQAALGAGQGKRPSTLDAETDAALDHLKR